MVRAKGMGYRVAEVPISFVDRGETLVYLVSTFKQPTVSSLWGV